MLFYKYMNAVHFTALYLFDGSNWVLATLLFHLKITVWKITMSPVNIWWSVFYSFRCSNCVIFIFALVRISGWLLLSVIKAKLGRETDNISIFYKTESLKPYFLRNHWALLVSNQLTLWHYALAKKKKKLVMKMTDIVGLLGSSNFSHQAGSLCFILGVVLRPPGADLHRGMLLGFL